MGSDHLIYNCRLVKGLNTYINEDQLMGSIEQLNSEVNKIESISGRSLHTLQMRSEIAKLEDRLSYTQNQAKLRTQQYNSTKPED